MNLAVDLVLMKDLKKFFFKKAREEKGQIYILQAVHKKNFFFFHVTFYFYFIFIHLFSSSRVNHDIKHIQYYIAGCCWSCSLCSCTLWL